MTASISVRNIRFSPVDSANSSSLESAKTYMQNPKNLSSYHHGNLKAALVDAYLELLSQSPAEKLSLRKLASHVGVAPTAVYNHFADKDALTTAVKARLLHHFADYLDSHCDPDESPETNLSRLSKAYFRYSIEHQQFFQIIFQQPKCIENVTDELIAAGMRAEEQLRKTVVALLEHHGIPISQYNEGLGAFACWSLAHGVTTLATIHVNRAACGFNRWPPQFMLDSEAAVNQAFDDLTRVLVAGVLAAARSEIAN